MSAKTDSDPTPEDYELANRLTREIIRLVKGDDAAAAFEGTEKYGPDQHRIVKRLRELDEIDEEPDLEDCE